MIYTSVHVSSPPKKYRQKGHRLLKHWLKKHIVRKVLTQRLPPNAHHTAECELLITFTNGDRVYTQFQTYTELTRFWVKLLKNQIPSSLSKKGALWY